MLSELSDFASRLRESICLDPLSGRSRWLDESQFDRSALELFRLQFGLNPAYRRLCEARQAAPGGFSHWAEVPSVPTFAFKEFEFSCLPSDQRECVFHSSGTTAQSPSRHYHNRESLTVYEAAAWTGFRQRMIPDLPWPPTDSAWIMLAPPPAQAPHSSLVHMFETLRLAVHAPASCFIGELGSDGSWSLDADRAMRLLTGVVQAERPVLLLGTAFLFVHLLDAISSRNLRFKLPEGSRIFETGGYKGRSRAIQKSELRALIQSHLGVPESGVISEYGMSELSSQAYDVPVPGTEVGDRAVKGGVEEVERLFQFPPWVRWQIISPETGSEVAPGETGLLRVHDLANVFSVMAVQTEDLAVRHEGGFDLVGRAEGSEARGCSLLSEFAPAMARSSKE